MTAFEFDVAGNGELTTREEVTRQVAQAWLAAHPDIAVTKMDLAKTTQQLITELFKTGGRRQREALSAHAAAVLGASGISPSEFAPVRSFAKAADMPIAYGAMVAAVASVLAPLAAAVQLARIPVTNAAALMVDPDDEIDRPQLRGFVVGHIRPHAQSVHARVGSEESVERYLRLILADVEALAAEVVESARAKNARPNRLDDAAAARMTRFALGHLPALTDYAAARFGQDADDIIGAALVKIAVQFRNNHELCAGSAWGRAAVDSAAKDLYTKRRNRYGHEVFDSEVLEHAAGTVDDTADIDEADAMLHIALAAAQIAEGQPAPYADAAREVLLHYFLVDPQEIDPRKARLARQALHLTAADQQGGLRAALGEVAASLGYRTPALDQVTALAIAALRSQAIQGRN